MSNLFLWLVFVFTLLLQKIDEWTQKYCFSASNQVCKVEENVQTSSSETQSAVDDGWSCPQCFKYFKKVNTIPLNMVSLAKCILYFLSKTKCFKWDNNAGDTKHSEKSLCSKLDYLKATGLSML